VLFLNISKPFSEIVIEILYINYNSVITRKISVKFYWVGEQRNDILRPTFILSLKKLSYNTERCEKILSFKQFALCYLTRRWTCSAEIAFKREKSSRQPAVYTECKINKKMSGSSIQAVKECRITRI